MEQDFSKASQAFGESIMTLEDDEKAFREPMPRHRSADPVRDQEAEPSPDVAEVDTTE